ncbi:MAG: DUF2780 domain-containing protein [Deltaproteobacteria bacterium]|nr:DUF2780 domain-containing protein [Deltaproteobacteria bacterium]
MEEFIQSAVKQLGISEDTAKTATGSLLGFLKNQGDNDTVQKLLAKLPGAEALISNAGASSGGGGGGLLGGLTSAIGGSLGGAGGALAALQSSGLDASKGSSLVKMLVDYAKQKAGPELVEQALAKFPALKALA